jgi:hypothetical protein
MDLDARDDREMTNEYDDDDDDYDEGAATGTTGWDKNATTTNNPAPDPALRATARGVGYGC